MREARNSKKEMSRTSTALMRRPVRETEVVIAAEIVVREAEAARVVEAADAIDAAATDAVVADVVTAAGMAATAAAVDTSTQFLSINVIPRCRACSTKRNLLLPHEQQIPHR